MKKILSVLAVCALIVCLACSLVACNKETVDDYTMSESELASTLSDLQTAFSTEVSSYLNKITLTTVSDGATSTQVSDAYVINTTGSLAKSYFFWEYVDTDTDGNQNRTLTYNINDTFYAVLEFEGNGEDYTSSAAYENAADGLVKITALKSQSKVTEAIEKLSNVLGNCSLADIACKDYKKGDSVYKSEYAFSYDDGSLEGNSMQGTMKVTAENGKLSAITFTESNYTNSTQFVYEFSNPLDDTNTYPTSVKSWKKTYP